MGCMALKKALSLMNGEQFEDIHPRHNIVGNILIRTHLLRKIPREKFTALILNRVAPLMGETEVISVDVQVELFLEDQV